MHGRLKAAERREVMRAFKDGELDVLVATTVIEVGVDVPNATIMIVQEADRFGLAQLHQLRGRVGRGAEQSYCLLISRAKAELTDSAQARLQALVDTTDGFELAERDLELRGEGALLGTRQSGLSDLRFTRLRAGSRPARAGARAGARARAEPGPWHDEANRLLAGADPRSSPDATGPPAVTTYLGLSSDTNAAVPRARGQRSPAGATPRACPGSGLRSGRADRRRQPQGHRIDAPKGAPTRPTSDFVREAAFNLIGPVDGATVLDLYAGSGAMGLEALSRGRRALRRSSSPTATPAARSTRTSTSCASTARVLCQDAAARSPRASAAPTISFSLDPPYDDRLDDRLAPAPAPRILAPDGLLVYETAAARPSPRSTA